MDYKELTDEEVGKIVKHFLSGGETYVTREECYLGYYRIAGLCSYVTEIFVDSNQVVNITIFNEGFSDNNMTPQEVVGYLRREMEDVMPGALADKRVMEEKHVSVDFFW